MKPIDLPVSWAYDLPSVVFIQFQIDLAKLNDESNDMSEFPCFCIDLKTGELLGISAEIATGDAYEYESSANWLVEGDGWWIGYNESMDEPYDNISNAAIKDEVIQLFDFKGQSFFSQVVALVCDVARTEDLRDLPLDGLYAKYINNDEAPSLG